MFDHQGISPPNMAMNTIDVLGKNRAQLMKKKSKYIVDLPMKNGGSFCDSLPEVNLYL